MQRNNANRIIHARGFLVRLADDFFLRGFLLSVARWMRMGRDDSHGEMILGKIYAEQGKRFRSKWILERAERVAQKAGNRINLADVKMVRGFWCKRFGTRKEQVKTLREALRIYRDLYEFDAAQKEKYMSRKFPEVWDEVLERIETEDKTKQRRPGMQYLPSSAATLYRTSRITSRPRSWKLIHYNNCANPSDVGSPPFLPGTGICLSFPGYKRW